MPSNQVLPGGSVGGGGKALALYSEGGGGGGGGIPANPPSSNSPGDVRPYGLCTPVDPDDALLIILDGQLIFSGGVQGAERKSLCCGSCAMELPLRMTSAPEAMTRGRSRGVSSMAAAPAGVG